MELSANNFTDSYGDRYTVYFYSTNGFAVFDSEPHIAIDTRKHGLYPRRRTYCDYTVTLCITEKALILESIEGEFKTRLFRKLPKLFGAEAQRSVELGRSDNPRSLSYIFDETFDYTGKLTVGKGFITKHYPDDDKVRPCPFSPDVYNNVFELELEHGRIIGIKMIKGTAEECR